jgi:peptide/nickel transport system substrate-binding protein
LRCLLSVDGQLDPIDTAIWFPKVIRKDYSVGLTVTETALDDPDTLFYENYACGAERNYTGYCSPQLDQMIDRQSIEADENKRRALVWRSRESSRKTGCGQSSFTVGSRPAGSPG